MASELARRLAAEGHHITLVVQFPTRPEGVVHKGYTRRLRKVQVIDGVRVIRCASWAIGRQRRHLSRVLENLTFGLTGALNLLLERNPDVIISENWPLIATQFTMLVAWIRRTPVIYYVKDVYPEAAEEVGVLRKGGFISGCLRRWDRLLCRRSTAIVAISESMRQVICGRGVPGEKVTVICDWIDAAAFALPSGGGNAWRHEKGIPDSTFIAMFAGTIGLVSGADILIDVALALRDQPDFLLLCVGEGLLKDSMAEKARQYGLSNIRFLPFEPRERVVGMHASADLMLLTMQKGYPDVSVPSKLITYLASGKPVVCAVPPEAAVAQVVLGDDCGVVVPPGDAPSIARAILDIIHTPGAAARLGGNARVSFEKRFTFERAYAQFRDLLARTRDEKKQRTESGSIRFP